MYFAWEILKLEQEAYKYCIYSNMEMLCYYDIADTFAGVIIYVAILAFKNNKDILSSFSKLDGVARIS